MYTERYLDISLNCKGDEQLALGVNIDTLEAIHPCHTAAILSREIKRGLFYHAKPRNGNHGDEA